MRKKPTAVISNMTFGFLTTIERTVINGRGNWKCICKCGKIKTMETRQLTSQKFPNCGCINDFVKSIVASKYNSNFTKDDIYYIAEKFKDHDRFLFVAQRIRHTLKNKDKWLELIEYFYFDKQFNKVYDFWLSQPRYNTFYDFSKPSLDHKIPRSKGGGDNIENLHFITMFENYNKRDMTWEEWCDFKRRTNSNSDYYIEKIME